ncbi:MAG: hypothetical protein WDZ80_04070 [Candidatus Paceibacterota bacterium]
MNYWNKIINFLNSLSSKPDIGGLQITDSSIQIIFLKEKSDPVSKSFQLSPGIIKSGKIQDEKALLSYFQELHKIISPADPDKKIKIVASLPSSITYTQIFSVPNVGVKKLQESVELNLQMISPIPTENAYMSWQVVNQDEDKFEILGAFSEKLVVDKFLSVMDKSNFQAIALEFPSLSLSWTISSFIGTKKESFLVLNISSDGFDIFLIKNGSIYFDYFRSWQSIKGNEKQISAEVFNSVVVEEVRKVVDFTSNRFRENLKKAILIAPGLEDKVKQIIENNFDIQTSSLVSNFRNLGPAWYVTLGAAIRGKWDRSKDNFISLGTERSEVVFYREQILDFIRLWRNILTFVASSFLVIFAASYLLINSQSKVLDERVNMLNIAPQESEVNELRQTAEEFNNLVSTISESRGIYTFSQFFDDFISIAERERIIIDSINFNGFSESISVVARAPNHDSVISFRNILSENNSFSQVELPFSQIASTQNNRVKFSLSFVFN